MSDSTSTTGGGLHFDATIGESGFNASINAMNTKINSLSANVVDQGEKIEGFAKKVSDANTGILERLKEKLAEFKASADSAMSVGAIEKYNTKIQDFEAEIKRLTNVGKTGFDDLGNAIKASYERPIGTLNRLIELQRIYKEGAAGMSNPELIAKYNQKLEETAAAISRTKNAGKAGFDEVGNALKQTIGYQETLTNRLKIYADAVRAQPNTGQGAANIVALNKKIEETQTELQKLNNAGKKGFDEFGNSVQKAGGFLSGLKDQVIGMVGSYLTLYAAVAAIKSIIHSNAELSDSISDVKRTTKESTEEVGNLVAVLKDYDSRTTLGDLLDIGFVGGQLNVAKKDLVGYIETIDQLAVVLKKEFPGGAETVARSLGKIIAIYQLTSKENISLEDSLKKVGSAFLGLAHSGPINVQFLQDFALRTAGAAQVAKLSLPTMLAFGAVLSEAGISAQIAASSTNRLVSSLSGKSGKYFAIAQLGDASLTLEKFNRLVNTDSKKALDLFFTGLNSGNPSTIEFNQRLGTLGFKVGAATNAITALALHQADLTKKIDIGNNSYGEGVLVTENFTEKNNNLAASLAKVGNAISNIFNNPDSALGKSFKFIVDSVYDATKALSGFLNFLGKIQDVKTYNPFDIAGSRKAAAEDAKVAQDQLRKNAAAANRDAIEGTATIKAKLIVDTNVDAPALEKAIKVQQDKLDRLYDQSNYAKAFAKNPKNSDKDIQPFIEKFKSLQAPLYQQQVLVDKLKGSYKGLYGAVQETFDGSNGDNRTTEDIKAEIKALVDANKKLDTQSALFKSNIQKIKALKTELKLANGGVDHTGETAANQYATALKARNTLQDKIAELTKKGTDRELSANDQEVESVKDKYAKMRAEAVTFNADPKNKAKNLTVTTSGLANSQKKEVEAVVYKQQTVLYNAELDKQKDLYAQYEEYKTNLGEVAAKERFGNEINTNRTLLEDLEAQRAQLLVKDPTQMTIPEKDRLTGLDTRINDQVKIQKQKYTDLLVSLRSYQEQSTSLTDTYEKRKKEINDKDGILNPAKAKAQILLLSETYAADNDNLKASVLDKAEAYKHLNEEVINYTKQQLQSQVEALEYTLKNATGLAPKLRESLANELGEVKIRLNLGGGDKAFNEDLKKKKAEIESALSTGLKVDDAGTLTNVKLTSEEYAKQVKLLAEINDKIKLTTSQRFDKLSQDLAAIGGAFDDLSSAVGDSNAGLKDTFAALGEIAKVGSDAAGSVASFTSGDIVGGVTKGIKALTGAIGFFNRGKESAKKAAAELLVYQDDLLKNEITYNETIRDRERTLKDINSLSVKELITQQALLALQKTQAKSDYDRLLAQIQNSGQQITGTHIEKHGGVFGIGKKSTTVTDTAGIGTADYDILEKLYLSGKLTDATKAWFEELKKAKDEADAIATATTEAQDALNQKLTATTASSISDAIIQGFKDGKRTAADFADDFKGYMTDAMYAALKNDFLDGAIADFYKKFAEVSKDGLTAEETKALQEQYQGIIAQGIEKASQIDLVTGSLGGKAATKTGVSGAIVGEALTEGTANRGLGIWLAQLDEIKRQGILSQSYFNLSAMNFKNIEANTFRTANNTDVLIDMAVDMKKVVLNTTKEGSTATSIDQLLRNNGIK